MYNGHSLYNYLPAIYYINTAFLHCRGGDGYALQSIDAVGVSRRRTAKDVMNHRGLILEIDHPRILVRQIASSYPCDV